MTLEEAQKYARTRGCNLTYLHDEPEGEPRFHVTYKPMPRVKDGWVMTTGLASFTVFTLEDAIEEIDKVR